MDNNNLQLSTPCQGNILLGLLALSVGRVEKHSKLYVMLYPTATLRGLNKLIMMCTLFMCVIMKNY